MFTSAFRMSMTASTGVSYETEASTYFAAIATAGSTITTANKAAVNAFIVGCKADGIWTAIKASCLLAGPDSLAGALVPLVGAAPTNNGPFVSGDYSRTTGLVGDGLTKQLDSNYNPSVLAQDNVSAGVWVSTLPSAERAALSSGRSAPGSLVLTIATTSSRSRCRSGTFSAGKFVAPLGLVGISRSASTEYTLRSAGSNVTVTNTSEAPYNGTAAIFNHKPTPSSYFDGRLSFYHIGESLDLALLNARLTTYMAALT
jgi:hypothetical protein